MKIVRVYQPDEERQLQALLLLLRSAPPPLHPATDDPSRLPGSPTGFEARTPSGPSSPPVDETRKDNELREESDDGIWRASVVLPPKAIGTANSRASRPQRVPPA
jgi:hypothetical protein